MAKPFRRLIWLVRTIQDSGSISFENLERKWVHSELNDMGESRLPRRTLQNHIKDLDSSFGIKIRCNRQTGKYYIDEKETDEYALFSMMGVILSCERQEDDTIHEHIHISSYGLINNNVPVIASAIKERRGLVITKSSWGYYDEDEPYIKKKYPDVDLDSFVDTPYSFLIYPYYLDYYRMLGGAWALIGFVPERNRIEVHTTLGRVELADILFDFPENLSLNDIRKEHFTWIKEKDYDLYDDRIDYSESFPWDMYDSPSRFVEDEEEEKRQEEEEEKVRQYRESPL